MTETATKPEVVKNVQVRLLFSLAGDPAGLKGSKHFVTEKKAKWLEEHDPPLAERING